MKTILLVKTSSMGDMIQTFPALTDAAHAIPGFKVDWIAEESFIEIPRLHPSVDAVINLPYRRWQREVKQSLKNREPQAFLQTLRKKRYDMIIDAQSNLKSAFISRLAKGVRYGLDAKSVREFGAQFAYQKKIYIDRNQNHANRMRQLLATFLHYDLPQSPANYGICVDQLPKLDFQLPEPFIFIVPIASWANKLWPEPFWQEVIQDLVHSDHNIVIPWWSKDEKERALRLKNNHENIHLLPPLNLAQKATVISKASAVISLDTGLAHMSAALHKPNLTLYGPSDANACGTVGENQLHLKASTPSCVPCFRSQCNYQGHSTYQPACLESIKPKQVLDSFYKLKAILNF